MNSQLVQLLEEEFEIQHGRALSALQSLHEGDGENAVRALGTHPSFTRRATLEERNILIQVTAVRPEFVGLTSRHQARAVQRYLAETTKQSVPDAETIRKIIRNSKQ